MNLSIYIPSIRGLFPHSAQLFFFVLLSLGLSAITANRASFSPLSVKLSLSPSYTRCISVPMNIASAARCRKYII